MNKDTNNTSKNSNEKNPITLPDTYSRGGASDGKPPIKKP